MTKKENSFYTILNKQQKKSKISFLQNLKIRVKNSSVYFKLKSDFWYRVNFSFVFWTFRCCNWVDIFESQNIVTYDFAYVRYGFLSIVAVSSRLYG